MTRWLGVALVLVACGDDDGMARVDGGLCTSAADCDDGVFCNGAEQCEPTGCVTGAPPCLASQTCDEGMDRCVSDCAVAADADGDGVEAIDCGGTDCDDANANRFPGNPEICDEGDVDEDCDPATYGARDDDGDGVDDARCCNDDLCGEDCDDSRPDVRPTAPEVCDARDNDCDGTTDEGVLVTLWPDGDGDGFGAMDGATIMGCPSTTPGFVDDGTDCDDENAGRNPGLAEVCDDIADNACDMGLSPFDGDGDGYDDLMCGGNDCNDLNPARNPGVVDLCDGIDRDCDTADEDDDFDFFLGTRATCVGGPGGDLPRTDCLPDYVLGFPGAFERCDGVDTDCDPATTDELFPGAERSAVDAPERVDFRCFGEDRLVPIPGAPTEVTIDIRDPSEMPVVGLQVEIHRDNVIVDTCEAPRCVVETTDVTGRILTTLDAGTYFAYRIAARGAFLEKLQTNVPVDPFIGLGAVPAAVLDTVADMWMPPPLPENGVIQIRASDCGNQRIRNLQFRVYGAGGEADAPVCGFYLYINGGTPSAPSFGFFSTDESGQGFVFNVPAPLPTNRYIVEMWGVANPTGIGGDTFQVLGREEVFVRANAISDVNLGPLRANGPTR